MFSNLGITTDLFFFDEANIRRRDGYTVVRTPEQPDYFWGNFLIMDEPPGPGAYQRWRRLFEREFGTTAGVQHVTFEWDAVNGDQGSCEEFVDNGFELEETEVLVANRVEPPPHKNSTVEIRRLAEDEDWLQLLELSILTRDPDLPEEMYGPFAAKKLASRRRLVSDGCGNWVGAFDGDRLVAGLGLFDCGAGIGRFQDVATHPDYRRRGICGTLVHHASVFGLGRSLSRLVMVAADDNHRAARVYRSVGFESHQRTCGLGLYPSEWKDGADAR